MANISSLFEAELARLRRYARALEPATRADELVQSCLTRAVAKRPTLALRFDIQRIAHPIPAVV